MPNTAQNFFAQLKNIFIYISTVPCYDTSKQYKSSHHSIYFSNVFKLNILMQVIPTVIARKGQCQTINNDSNNIVLFTAKKINKIKLYNHYYKLNFNYSISKLN